VAIDAPAGLELHNRITPVRLDALHGDTLMGTMTADETCGRDMR
jgi:hypothetical protein